LAVFKKVLGRSLHASRWCREAVFRLNWCERAC
jgi:hypothetical protein